MGSVIIEKPDTAKATAPAKRWFNWFFAFEDFTLTHLDGTVEREIPKNRRFSIGPYPSKETAEEFAGADMERNNGWPEIEYLGAYPEGARPASASAEGEK